MPSQIIAPAEFKADAWKNGKGSTCELKSEHLCAEEGFVWRLSIAPVKGDGGFSDFSGYQRHLTLIEGDGITLNHGNGQIDELRRRFDYARFDGGWSTTATLRHSPIVDFNVITRSEICTAEVKTLGDSGLHLYDVSADRLLIYAIDRDCDIVDTSSVSARLPAGHLFYASDPAAGRWHITGAAVMCVQIYWAQ